MPFTGLPPMPAPNGNAFDNYVSEALRALMAFHEEERTRAEARKRWVQINLLALLAIAIGGILFYARAKTHLDDASIHPMRVEREAEFDQRLALKMEARDVKLEQSIKNQEKMQSSLDRIEERVEGVRELAVRRNQREENFNHTGRQ